MATTKPAIDMSETANGRSTWSRAALRRLLEELVGASKTREVCKEIRHKSRAEQRELLNAEISMASAHGTQPRCALEAELEELLGTKGLQAFIGRLQYRRDSDDRMAAIRAEIERVRHTVTDEIVNTQHEKGQAQGVVAGTLSSGFPPRSP